MTNTLLLPPSLLPSSPYSPPPNKSLFQKKKKIPLSIVHGDQALPRSSSGGLAAAPSGREVAHEGSAGGRARRSGRGPAAPAAPAADFPSRLAC